MKRDFHNQIKKTIDERINKRVLDKLNLFFNKKIFKFLEEYDTIEHEFLCSFCNYKYEKADLILKKLVKFNILYCQHGIFYKSIEYTNIMELVNSLKEKERELIFKDTPISTTYKENETQEEYAARMAISYSD